MIIDTLRYAHHYYDMLPGLDKAMHFIKTTDFSQLKAGRYEIDGNRVVALIQEYDTSENPPWESHEFHVDVQYLIEGVEKIGYHPLKGMTPSQPYNVPDDYDLLHDVEGSYVTLKDDVFMLLFPQDGHQPRKAYDKPMPVRKCVIKILV